MTGVAVGVSKRALDRVKSQALGVPNRSGMSRRVPARDPVSPMPSGERRKANGGPRRHGRREPSGLRSPACDPQIPACPHRRGTDRAR